MTLTGVSPLGRFRSPLAEHLNSSAINYAMMFPANAGESVMLLKSARIRAEIK
jgi:hypothetical protein